MKQTPNQFSSPKKPAKQKQPKDEWAKIDKLKREKGFFKTEEQRVADMEDFEESYSSDFSLDSQTELPVERLNSTPRTIKSTTEQTVLPHPAKPGRIIKGKSLKSRPSSQRPKISMEPFNMREERDNHFIDRKGNFLYKNYRSHNDAWLLSLDEELTDPKVLGNKKKTYQFALNQKISRAKSEESSLISEDQMNSESFKERKIETLKTSLLGLLEIGESANKAIKRFTALLPEQKVFKHFKKNVRKNTVGKKKSEELTFSVGKPKLKTQHRSEKKKKLKAAKGELLSNRKVPQGPLLGKRRSFHEQPKVQSETSSVSSMNNNSLFDFDKQKLPKHLEKVGKSMMDSPGETRWANWKIS